MLQDNLRTAVYRSLIKPLPIGCENGKRTAECGTSRESETSHSVQVDLIDGTSHRDYGEAEEKDMDCRERSELQLFQVSRGARELTDMIDSWSKAPNLDGRSKYIAKDILRGSIDLQESLVMLAKLQDASKRMSRVKIKQRSYFMEEREQEEQIGFEAMGSKRFEKRCGQEPRLSFDGSSRNSIEELKRVIKDSLYRQNLLSVCSDDERASSSMEFLRSSRSSRFDERTFSSITSPEQPKMPKAPNLIAKLMGLEDVPSKAAESIKKEEVIGRKSFSLPRPTFDIEMPKARKLQLVEKSPDPNQKTLQEIIETMQFKGLLKSRQAEDLKNKSSHLSDASSQLQQRHGRNFSKDDEAPPIVIMKPLHLPQLERGEVQKEDLLLERMSVKQDIQSVKLSQEDKVPNRRKVFPETLERKEAKSIEKTKVEVKSREKIKLEPLQKAKNLATVVSQKQQSREAIRARNKLNEGQKPVLNGSKPEEKKDAKAKRMPNDQPKTTPKAPPKPDRRLSRAKTNVCVVKPLSLTSTNSAKEKKASGTKPVRKSATINAAINNEKCKNGKSNNPACETDALSTTTSTPADELCKPAKQEPKPRNKDDITKDEKLFRGVMPKINQDEISSVGSEDVIYVSSNKSAIIKASGMEDDIKRLLLSSQLFLSRAQELFGIDTHQPIYYQRAGIEEGGTRNTKLFLDCGKELIARKSRQQELLIHPMLRKKMLGQAISLSLDQLVEEISNGIKKLTSCIKVDDNVTSEDSMYTRLERDLRCKEMSVNAMWDIGWVNFVCPDEADQVVGEMEEDILSWLIEEVAMGFDLLAT